MSWIADWRLLQKLRSQERRIWKTFSKAYEKAINQNDQAAQNDLWGNLEQERLRNKIATEAAKTDILLRHAEKYDVPVPSMLLMGNQNESWYRSPLDQHSLILTEHARADLRAAIRIEKTAEWERWYRWVPLLTGLTGLFGTIIGLIAAAAKWL